MGCLPDAHPAPTAAGAESCTYPQHKHSSSAEAHLPH